MNSKQFATVVVITFVVGMVWLISDVIFNTKASIPVSDKLQSSLEPINPTFNQRVLETIANETLDTGSIVVTNAPPSPSPSPEALEVIPELPDTSPSPSPAVSPTPVAETSPVPSGQP